MHPIRTWIVIADGSRARILVNEGPNKGVQFVPGTDFRHELPLNREIYADRPGRAFDSSSPARSAMEQPDAHALEKARFVQQIVHFVNEQLQTKAFDRWLLIAPPEILGDFRRALTPQLKATLMDELPKDLTKVPTNEVPSYLTDFLPV